MSPMAKEQRIVIFKGNVQGVGFRYTAVSVAQQYDVAGYVRNLPDGEVELVAEGEGKDIDALVADIAGRFEGYIRSTTQQKAPCSGRFNGFGVKY